MARMRILSLLIACALAGDAFAVRGRPVSNHRFEGYTDPNGPSIASDGVDFLTLGSLEVQKVVNGRPAGPINPTLIPLDDHTWTGTHYLGLNFRWIVRLSREGSLISDPIDVFSEPGEASIVAGRSSALAFVRTWNDLRVRPVSLDGHPTGPETVLPHFPAQPPPSAAPRLAAAGDRFAAVLPSESGVELFLLRPDGSHERTVSILKPAAYDNSRWAFVASDGSNFLVAFVATQLNGGGPVLVTAVVGLDGTLRKRTEIRNVGDVPFRTVTPVGMVWADSQYYVLADVSTDPNTPNSAPALLRLTRDGDLTGGLVPLPGHHQAFDLAWNGRELAVVTGAGVSSVDPALRVSPPAKLGRSLSEQVLVAVAAGPGGYLAAWVEDDDGATSVRASRVDAAGNYLDGDGIILGSSQATFLAIDGNGPHWLVAWTSGGVVRVRALSFAGVPASADVPVGSGHVADLLWRGSQYVLLRWNDDALYADTLRQDGTVVATRELVPRQTTQFPGHSTVTYAVDAHLLPLRDRLLMVYGAVTATCKFFCSPNTTVKGLSLDTPGATPFVIDDQGFISNVYDVASDGERGLVVWALSNGVYGRFLTGEQPGPRFVVNDGWTHAVVAHDGAGFVAVTGSFLQPMTTARIQPDGTVTGRTVAVHDGILEPQDLAASATLPALLGYRLGYAGYRKYRAALLFTSEFAPPAATPPAPQIVCATENPDGTISVRWQPAVNALGVSIELQLADGTFREIAVAAAGATAARVSRSGLTGNAVRVRAWNALGLSQPSAIAPSVPPPAASLRSGTRTCAGKPLTINYTLSGAAPFTVRWSDGLVQTNQPANASRTVTVSRDTTLAIVSVTDASCGARTVDTVHSIRILVDPAATIGGQPREVKIQRGQTATLTIEADDDLSFAWFEGDPADMSRPVGRNDPTFTTPTLQATTRYWVRVSNRCGTADSDPIVVVVSGGKGRAVRK